MIDRKAIKRALESLGFVFLRGGWVRKEVAPRLQGQIDRAVGAAAEDVESVKQGAVSSKSSEGVQHD